MSLDISLLLLLAHLLEAFHLSHVSTVSTHDLRQHLLTDRLLLGLAGILVVQDGKLLFRQAEHILNLILPLLALSFHLCIGTLVSTFLQLLCTSHDGCYLLRISLTFLH